MLELAYASYNQRKSDIDRTIDAFVDDYSGRPGVPEGLVRQDWVNASLPSELPAPADMITDKRKTQLETRVGGPFRTDMDLNSWIIGNDMTEAEKNKQATGYQQQFDAGLTR